MQKRVKPCVQSGRANRPINFLRVLVSERIQNREIETRLLEPGLKLSNELGKEIEYIVVNCFYQTNSLDIQNLTLLDTINKNFSGFKGLIMLPMWKTHIDVALSVFNNRIKTKSSYKHNPVSSTSELLKPHIENVDLEMMETILTQQICRKGYSYGCCFLRRIPSLDAVEVEELYTFIVDWMVKEYTSRRHLCKDSLTVESVMTSNFLPDRGPSSEMPDDVEPSSLALEELREIWTTLEQDMPILRLNVPPIDKSANEDMTVDSEVANVRRRRSSNDENAGVSFHQPKVRFTRSMARLRESRRFSRLSPVEFKSFSSPSSNSSFDRIIPSTSLVYPSPPFFQASRKPEDTPAPTACDCGQKKKDLESREKLLQEKYLKFSKSKKRFKKRKKKLSAEMSEKMRCLEEKKKVVEEGRESLVEMKRKFEDTVYNYFTNFIISMYTDDTPWNKCNPEQTL